MLTSELGGGPAGSVKKDELKSVVKKGAGSIT